MTLLALAVAGQGLVDPNEPAVHADDEAVLRGRAAFETLRVYGGVPFKLESHSSGSRLVRAHRRRAAGRGGGPRAAALALAHAGEPDAVLRFYRTSGREQADSPRLLVLVNSLPDQPEGLRSRGIRLVSLLGVRAEARGCSAASSPRATR